MKRSWKVILVAVPILALLSTLASDAVHAQTFLNKPAIEGVSYAELAEWQVMYGGRSSLFGYGGPGYGSPVYGPGVCAPEPASTYRVQKRATRKGRK
jgi:hypothetical protein